MAVILGVSCYHPDSSACLVVNGEVISAIAEERLGDRLKHVGGFPHRSIDFVLKQSNCNIDDVEHIAIARDSKANKIQRAKRYMSFRGIRSALNRLQDSTSSLQSDIQILKKKSKSRKDFRIHFVEHHLAHLASSYFTSPFDSDVTGFTYDGSGDGVSSAWAECDGSQINIISRDFVPNSLGHFYTALCQLIGFTKYGEEYKVMGLAPYGEETFVDRLEKLIQVNSKGLIKLNTEYIDTSEVDTTSSDTLPNFFTSRLLSHLDLDEPLSRKKLTRKHKDIARSAQAIFEKSVISVLKNRSTGKKISKLVTAGGCALNGVTNARIQKDLDIRNHFIHPAASDDGTSLGAALYVAHSTLAEQRTIEIFSPYLGGQYDTYAFRNILNSRSDKFLNFKDFSVCSKLLAYLISRDLVIGYFNGRSEWGPRALGNRSILANPLCKDMKDIINAKVKKRESFRPFAPSVLAGDASLYFEQTIESAYMMHVVKFKEEFRETFPCVTHVDFTGRLQTVTEDLNPQYFSIIKNFKQITGHGIILNTSFNENEPIVETPSQALACYDRTDIDALFVNDTILFKNTKHRDLAVRYIEE